MTAAIVVSEASKKRNVKVSEDESGKKWNAFSVTPHELLKSADAPLAPSSDPPSAPFFYLTKMSSSPSLCYSIAVTYTLDPLVGHGRATSMGIG